MLLVPKVVSSYDSPLLSSDFFVSTCMSIQSWAQVVFHVSTSLMDSRRVLDFSVCLAFYLLEQSGDFQASYM